MNQYRLRLMPDPSPDLFDQRGDNPHFKLLIDGWTGITDRRIDLDASNQKNCNLTLVLWPDSILEKLTTSFVMRVFGRLEHKYMKRLSMFYLSQAVDRACKRIMKLKGLVFWQIHELSGHYVPNEYLSLDQKIRQTIIDKSSALFITERSTHQEISKHFLLKDKECFISHLGSYRSFYGERIDFNLARKELNIPPGKTTVLLFGRARKDKDFNSIIKGLIEKGFYLIFAGQGYSELNIEKSKYLHIPGFVPKSEVVKIFSAADYLIKPEKNYLNSGVIRLAISYGKPVIAYGYGSTKDLTEGCLIDLSNPEWSGNIPNRDSVEYRNMALAAEKNDESRTWRDAAQKIHDRMIRVIDEEGNDLVSNVYS